MVFLLLKIFLWPLVWLFIRRIDGVGNIPRGRFIVAANHASYIDPVLLLLVFAVKRDVKVRFLATKDSRFRSWWWDFWFDYVGAIRVNGSVDKAVAAAQEDCVGIFPEGRRTSNGRVQKIEHTGLGVIALKTGLPVVPVGTNTFWFWSRFHKFPSFRRSINVSIGKPLRFRQKLTERNAKKVVDAVMKEVKVQKRRADG